MNSPNRGRLLLAIIMALAFLSYLTITANAFRAAGGGIYEVEVSNLVYGELLGTSTAGASSEMKPLAPRMRR